MAKKLIRRKSLSETHEIYQRFKSSFLSSCRVLEEMYICNDTSIKNRIAEVRSANRPFDMDKYYNLQYDRTYSRSTLNTYDPTPFNVLDAAVAGLLSYHYSPVDKFMALYDKSFLQVEENKKNADTIKKLANRTDNLHLLLQNPSNVVTEANIHYSKILFGLAGKVLHYKDSLYQALHYPPEQLALGSSDGYKHNIFGYRESLSGFQALSRFPEPFDKEVKERWNKPTLRKGNLEEYHCFNIPYTVLYTHVKHFAMSNTMDEKDFARGWETFVGRPAKDARGKGWVKLVWTPSHIIHIETINERDIVICNALPPASRLGVSKGFGERALPLVVAMASKMDIDVDAYEKSLGPPVAIPDESKTFGLEVQQDGIIYTGEGRHMPQYVQLPVNGGLMDVVRKTYLELLKESYMVDVFETAQKYNMTTAEVDLSTSNKLRKAIIYTIIDQDENLTPTCSYLNYHLDMLDKGGELNNLRLGVRYISPASVANINSYFQNVDRALLSLVNLGKAKKESKDAEVMVDFGTAVKRILDKSNLEELLNGEKEIAKRRFIQEEALKTGLNKARDEEEGLVLDNAQKRRAFFQGGGVDTEAGGEAQGDDIPDSFDGFGEDAF